MPPTPYEVLRIPRDCTNDAIRHAYRRLAKEYHPGGNPDNPTAQLRFIEISEAYQAISTEQKRKLWDLTNEPAPVFVAHTQPPPPPPPSPTYTAPQKPAYATATAYTHPTASRSGRVGRDDPEPLKRRSSFAQLFENDFSRFLLVGTGLMAVIIILVSGTASKTQEMQQPAGSPPAVAPQIVAITGPFTDAAIALLVNGGPRLDAVVTKIVTAEGKEKTRTVSYRYKDFSGRVFTGACAPCAYPAAERLAEGETIKVVHLADHNFSAPLFAFEDLTKVDRTLADHVNALAAQSSGTP